MNEETNHKELIELAMGIFSILFVSSSPFSKIHLCNALNISNKTLEEALILLKNNLDKYTPLFIQEIDNALCLKTRSEYYGYINSAIKKNNRRIKLSEESLITLAIIAYGQPIRKSKIDEIRGIDSERTIDTLKRYGLIKTTGRIDKPGLPLLYVTTPKFLETFGLKNLSDLPLPPSSEVSDTRIRELFLLK